MKFPKKIIIAGQEVTVQLLDGGNKFFHAGDFCCMDNIIRINLDGTVEAVRAESFLHEIIESININNELKLEHNKICTLSSQIFAVIRDNKLDFRK